eukprot:4446275-Lingulodinium_polyedra.AAC.1
MTWLGVNRCVYGKESCVGSLKPQHESQFLLDMLKSESVRPPWRSEVPPVPDEIAGLPGGDAFPTG